MPEWDSSEAPFRVAVDDPDAYTGHMEDKPVRLERPTGELVAVEGEMSPAEAYHLADDLIAAADACWGTAEYTVLAKTDHGRRFLGESKSESPKVAVQSVLAWLDNTGGKFATNDPPEGELSERAKDLISRWKIARQADEFFVYRADTLEMVTEAEAHEQDQQ